MEDNNIGKHCDYPNCGIQDYLNFHCDKCGKNLCKQHYHHEVSCPFVKDDPNLPQEKKEFNYEKIPCSFCGAILKNIKPFECVACHKLFCSQHRIESTHLCEKGKKESSTDRMKQMREKLKEAKAKAKKNLK